MSVYEVGPKGQVENTPTMKLVMASDVADIRHLKQQTSQA